MTKAMAAMKPMKAMRALKAMKAMKAMRAMKKKAGSKIAKGKYAWYLVYSGRKAKTAGGLTASDLIRNRHGKIVNKRRCMGNPDWMAACREARKALGLKGFVPIKKGTPFYNKAKEFCIHTWRK